MNVLAPSKPSFSNAKTPSTVFSRIKDYYRETIEDYQCWSPKGYMHFGLWDKSVSPFDRESMLERMNDRLFERLELGNLPASSIGDFGCGLGAVTRYGADRFPHHTWVGLTISPEQVAWADQRFNDHSCKILCADYQQTPFRDQSLGGIFFLESLCHSSDISKALTEAYRVLEPGRRVVIVDGMMKRSDSELAGHVKWLMKETCRNWAVPQFHHLQNILSSAENCGFKILQADDISWSIVPSVLHSPWLIARRALTLAIRQLTSNGKTPSPWQWRHLRACLLGMFLGMNRQSFGYYSIVLERKLT